MLESSTAIVSRRTTRYFAEKERVIMETGASEVRYGPCSEESEKERPQREATTSSTRFETGMIPVVDLGKDLGSLFPKTTEDVSKHAAKSLQAAKASTKSKIDGRPLNFGTVLPDTIYRSSLPQIEDFQFLGTLGLKTVVSLVNTDFSPAFRDFMRASGIHHCTIEMHGTKKVEISETIMQSIMEVVLDVKNHPLLIHCNQGKHRTGCAVAVLRHVSGWEVDQIVEEYQGHAEPKVRDCDVKYIRDYQVASLHGLFIKKQSLDPHYKFNSPKVMKMLLGTATALLIWIATWLFWDDRELGDDFE